MSFKRKLSSLCISLLLTLSLSLPVSAHPKHTEDIKTLQNQKVDYSMFGEPENESGLPKDKIVQPHHLPTSLGTGNNGFLSFLVLPESNLVIDGIEVSRQLIPINYYDEYQTPKYIVIHDTGNRAKGANAQAHRNYFARNENANASANYFIDDGHIIQTVDDHNGSWHCGDGRSPIINNKNSIGIEMCVNPEGDFKETVRHTIALTKYLMTKYNIPAERVVRHNDVSGKICPAMIIQDKVVTWDYFKKAIGGYDNSLTRMNKLGKVIGTNGLSVRENGGRNSGVINTLKSGEEVQITGRRLNGWYQIKLKSGKVGYCCDDSIKVLKDLGPVQDLSEHSLDIFGQVVKLDKGDTLNVRELPNANAKQVSTLAGGSYVYILSKCGNGWYKISFDGVTGYVCGYYLSEKPNIKLPVTREPARIRKEPKWSSETECTLPSKTYVNLTGYVSDFYEIHYGGKVGYIAQSVVKDVDKSKLSDLSIKVMLPSEKPKEEEKPVVKPQEEKKPVIKEPTVTVAINLRQQPKWTCEQLGVISQGTTVKPTAYKGEWILVDVNGKQGYINEEFLTNIDKSKLQEIVEVIDNASLLVSVNLRRDPNWSSERLGVIEQNTRVHFIQVDGEWSKVIVNGKTGYIYSDYLAVDGCSKMVTVTAYVNLRDSKSWSAKQEGVVPQGTKVKLIDKGTEWSKVQWGDKQGYIYNDYIS